MGQLLPGNNNSRDRHDGITSPAKEVPSDLLEKSTEELESALIEQLRLLERAERLPDELSEKLCRYNMLERQAITGMRFGMVISREELPDLRSEIDRTRRALIELCLTDYFAQELRNVA